MKKVKYSVIGPGWFGKMHLGARGAIPNVESHSVADPELEEVTGKVGTR